MSARFTNICPPVPSHWANKETATVYDRKTNNKIATVPAFPYRTRKEALILAKRICDLLNAAENAGGARLYCNDGDCERHDKGAEPCTDCPYCDEAGNI